MGNLWGAAGVDHLTLGGPSEASTRICTGHRPEELVAQQLGAVGVLLRGAWDNGR